MSAFVGAAQPNHWQGSQDLRLNRADWRPIGTIFFNGSQVAPASFETPWWPRGGGFIGDGGTDVGMLEAAWWGEYDQAAGASSRFGFVGVSRDQYGSVVGSCEMKLFRTSDSALIDSTVSDPTTGAFLLNTAEYPTAHWIYLHKSGSPDIDGVSVNTLIGT